MESSLPSIETDELCDDPAAAPEMVPWDEAGWEVMPSRRCDSCVCELDDVRGKVIQNNNYVR